MADPPVSEIQLNWSTQLRVRTTSSAHKSTLPGDKILLPASALEQLLSASATNVIVADRSRVESLDALPMLEAVILETPAGDLPVPQFVPLDWRALI